MNLREKLNLSYVPRWVIVPMTRPQSVADHSWRVAVIVDDLMRRMYEAGLVKPAFSDARPLSAVYRAVSHDLGEVKTGDIPSTAKNDWMIPSDPIDLIVKIADVIEARTWLVLWGHNSAVASVLDQGTDRWLALLTSLDNRFPQASLIVTKMVEEILNGAKHE